VSASHGATGRLCGRLDPFPEPPPPHAPGFINGVCKGSVSSWGRYDDHRLVARRAHRGDLINVDIERLSDKVGAEPEEVADAVFRWIEQYIDLGISSGATCGVLPTWISFDLSTMLCKWRFPLAARQPR